MSVNEVVPFLAVQDMQRWIGFYVEGLGFEFQNKWEKEGTLRWCHIRHGKAGLMLQQFRPEGNDSLQLSDNLGEGVSLFYFCDDAVALYRGWVEKELEVTEPWVGNEKSSPGPFVRPPLATTRVCLATEP